MASRVEQYLRKGSPFRIEVDVTLLEPILRDCFKGYQYEAGEALCKGLGYAVSSAYRALRRQSSRWSATNTDFARYFRGFTTVFSIVQIAYNAKVHGLDNAESIIRLLKQDDESERDLYLSLVSEARRRLIIDGSGRDAIAWCAYELKKVDANIYFQVGLEAARRLYFEYWDLLNIILVPPGSFERQGIPMIDLFTEIEQAPLSQVPGRRFNNEIAQEFIEFTKLMERPTCGQMFTFLLRHPGTVIGGLINLPKAIAMNRGQRHRFLQQAEVLSQKIGEEDPSVINVREARIQLHAEITSLGDQAESPTRFNEKHFFQSLRHIQTTPYSNLQTAKRFLEGWRKIGSQPGLKHFPAVWAAVHLAYGNHAYSLYNLYCDKAFLNIARESFEAPFLRSSIWRSDLGTRYTAGVSLSCLLFEKPLELDLSPSQMALELHDLYVDMLKTNERLYQRNEYMELKRVLQDRNDILAARIIETDWYLCQKNTDDATRWKREAFIIAEQAKLRMLREEMALAERVAPSALPATLARREQLALERLRAIYGDLRARVIDFSQGLEGVDEYVEQRNTLRLDLEEMWAQMEDYGEEAKRYIEVRRDEAIQWTGLQWENYQRIAEMLGSETAIISFRQLPEAMALLILKAGWDAPEILLNPLPRKRMQSFLEVYQSEILLRNAAQNDFGERWKIKPLTHEWQDLGEELFARLPAFLSGVKHLCFLPQGILYNIPLHALKLNGASLIERWSISYAPSLSALESTLSRPKPQGMVVSLGYANPHDNEFLKATITGEAEQVAQYFSKKAYIGQAATRVQLQQLASQAKLIHISSHGEYLSSASDTSDSLESGIWLADGKFTARDWLRLTTRADLVTLSGCETGISSARPGDDLAGLMRSVLFAGASSLIMTLWQVNARTTLHWMNLFYQQAWADDGVSLLSKAEAFRHATLAIRDQYPDPYYWAAYELIGNHH